MSRPSSHTTRAILFATVVAAATVFAFAPAFQAGWLYWDDNTNFLEHSAWRGLSPEHLGWMFTTLHGGPYQPLAWVTLGADYVVHGLDPRGYHVTSVIIHAAAGFGLFWLARALFTRVVRLRAQPAAISAMTTTDASRTKGRALEQAPASVGVPIPSLAIDVAALCAALVFAVHPLRVESVAWITERRDVLSGLFLVVSTLAWLRCLESAPAVRRRWLWLAVALYSASLLSKGLAMLFPLVLVVLDVLVLARWNGRLRMNGTRAEQTSLVALAREKIPFAIPAALAMLVAFVGQRALGSMLTVDSYPLPARLVQSAYGLFFYASRTVWPHDLVPLVPLNGAPDPMEPRFLVAIAAVIAAVVVLFALRKRAPALIAAVLAFALLVLPVIGLVQTGPQLVADRYSYLASMPLALLFGWVLVAAWTARPRWALIVTVLGLTCVTALLVACRVQTRVWHDDVSLWTRAVEVDPRDAGKQRNLSKAWLRAAENEPDAARSIALYQKAVERCRIALTHVADAGLLANAASAHAGMADREPDREKEHIEAALVEARRAIELGEVTHEPVAAAYENHGLLCVRIGRPADGVASFTWLAENQPNDAGKALMLGQVLALAARPREAVTALERAAVLAPLSPVVQMELGQAHRALGDNVAAAQCFERGIALAQQLPPADRPSAEDLAQWRTMLAEARAR